MGIRFAKKPQLENAVLVASWPGIGNIGVIAADTLRQMVEAEEFAEIEPWEFFYPKKVIIQDGEITDLQFPASKFYFKRTGETDLIFFVGEEQPTEAGRVYAAGQKAYDMANLVLDLAIQYECRRVYTSGAAVASIHHTARPKVWAVPNSESLIAEVSSYENTILMSDIEGRGGQGSITGLNGLLLGVARKRGVDAVCVMGEIPVYLQGLPLPYPKASRSVIEVLSQALGIAIEVSGISAMVESSEREIDNLCELFPAEIKEQLDRLRQTPQSEAAGPGPITDEDKSRILDDIDRFFKREPRED